MLLGQPWTRWLVLGLGAALLAAVLIALPQVERNGQPSPSTPGPQTLAPTSAAYPALDIPTPTPPAYPPVGLPTLTPPPVAYPLSTATAPPDAAYPAN